MQFETEDETKKRRFIAYLMLFLSVMNAIVIANSLLLFFFLFVITSYSIHYTKLYDTFATMTTKMPTGSIENPTFT